jgi:hypothetical protein
METFSTLLIIGCLLGLAELAKSLFALFGFYLSWIVFSDTV